jgi:hypothetical protein
VAADDDQEIGVGKRVRGPIVVAVVPPAQGRMLDPEGRRAGVRVGVQVLGAEDDRVRRVRDQGGDGGLEPVAQPAVPGAPD